MATAAKVPSNATTISNSVRVNPRRRSARMRYQDARAAVSASPRVPQYVEYATPLLSRALLFITITPAKVSYAHPPVAAAGAGVALVEVMMIPAATAPTVPPIGSLGIPL